MLNLVTNLKKFLVGIKKQSIGLPRNDWLVTQMSTVTIYTLLLSEAFTWCENLKGQIQPAQATLMRLVLYMK